MTYRFKCVSSNDTHEMHEIFIEFYKFKKYEKATMMVTIDGGSVESLRYTNTIKCAIGYFVFENLNLPSIATSAPGGSAFNRCERKMTPESKEISGIISEDDQFVSHLMITR